MLLFLRKKKPIICIQSTYNFYEPYCWSHKYKQAEQETSCWVRVIHKRRPRGRGEGTSKVDNTGRGQRGSNWNWTSTSDTPCCLWLTADTLCANYVYSVLPSLAHIIEMCVYTCMLLLVKISSLEIRSKSRIWEGSLTLKPSSGALGQNPIRRPGVKVHRKLVSAANYTTVKSDRN